MKKEETQELIGSVVKDKISGYQGVAIAKVIWVFGCEQYLVLNKAGEGKSCDTGRPFDSGRLEVIDKVEAVESITIPKPDKEMLGKTVKDKITGFTGTCIGVEVKAFTDTVSYAVENKVDEKNENDTRWFEGARLEVIAGTMDPEDVQNEYHGGILPSYMYQGL